MSRKAKYPWEKLKRKGSTVEIPVTCARDEKKARSAASQYSAYNGFSVECKINGDCLVVKRA